MTRGKDSPTATTKMMMTTTIVNNNNNHDGNPQESSPLLVSTLSQEYSELDDDLLSLSFSSARHVVLGTASTSETVTNLAKTCMGTGCLALPYAAKQGGVLLYVIGTVFIALWNLYGSIRLGHCLHLLQHGDGRTFNNILPTTNNDDTTKVNPSVIGSKSSNTQHLAPPPNGTATLGKVAWYALGPQGLILLDLLTCLLLMGIVIAYEDAIRAFLRGTPFTSHNDAIDAIITALIIAPLTLTDVGFLGKTSAAGLSVLGLTFIVIAGYGLKGYDYGTNQASSALTWLPLDGLTGISNWFGCTVFGFGIVPLTFNFKESMKEPSEYPMAATFALLVVCMTYIAIGLVLLVLYPNVDGDVLSEIPQEGILPIVTRLSMVLVLVVTVPLVFIVSQTTKMGSENEHGIHPVLTSFSSLPILFYTSDFKPCAELVEGKLGVRPRNTVSRTVLRFGLCSVTVTISVAIPEFVNVLTLVGSFSVAFVSFCIPPFLYLVIQTSKQGNNKSITSLAFDVLMLLWGLISTAISTTYIFSKMISKK